MDTSVVFPHKMGAPYKRALRNLAAEYLKRIIQDDGKYILGLIWISLIFANCSMCGSLWFAFNVNEPSFYWKTSTVMGTNVYYIVDHGGDI